MKKFITTIIVAAMCHISYGQIPASVDYIIKYNTTDCKYEACMIVNSTTSGLSTGGAAQFTVVVPASMSSSALGGVESVNPSTTSWSHPTGDTASTSTHSYYSVQFAGGANYSSVSSGDTVTLFKFSLNNDVCATNNAIRPWASGTDPVTPGSSSGNFTNALTIGFINRYSGNRTTVAPVSAPTVNLLAPNCSSSSKGIALSASANGLAASCGGSLVYAWTGPNSFTATTANITVPDTTASIGTYSVTITDGFGCTTTDNQTLDSTNCFTAPVPVSMISFDGIRVNQVNKLYWSTATEINNKHFIVERKIGNGEFEPIGTVASLAEGGNSTSILDYSFNDYDVTQPGVDVLYMLKQVDFDQAFEYHGPVRLSTDESVDIAVYPNPANDKITVVGLDAEYEYTVGVYDLIGKELISGAISAREPGIDVSLLSMGVYNIVVVDDRGIELSTKVIITN